MKPWLTIVTEYAVILIDGMALIIVLIGTLAAFVAAMRWTFAPADAHARRRIWLSYSRWLVAALTFQLAADIVESSIATDWMAVARLAAIAAIRTFLDYFLERDLADMRARERQCTPEAAVPT